MPRKTWIGAVRKQPFIQASMRPRPDAAENNSALELVRTELKASMRPRPDAAENHHAHRRPAGDGRASMRPRPDAAENRDPEDGTYLINQVLQ